MLTQFYNFQWLNSVTITQPQKVQKQPQKVLLNYIQIIGRKLCVGYMTQGQYTKINCIFYVSVTNIYKWNFKKYNLYSAKEQNNWG